MLGIGAIVGSKQKTETCNQKGGKVQISSTSVCAFRKDNENYGKSLLRRSMDLELLFKRIFLNRSQSKACKWATTCLAKVA